MYMYIFFFFFQIKKVSFDSTHAIFNSSASQVRVFNCVIDIIFPSFTYRSHCDGSYNNTKTAHNPKYSDACVSHTRIVALTYTQISVCTSMCFCSREKSEMLVKLLIRFLFPKNGHLISLIN